MRRLNTTEETKKLYAALIEKGVDAMREYNDGYKTVDIFIPSAKLYIEVDGGIHHTWAEKIETDLKRDSYSREKGIDTIRLPNEAINKSFSGVVDAIAKVVEHRKHDLEK